MDKKYSKIRSFSNVVRYVNKYFSNPPVITYQGTTKLHGTNSSIRFLKDGTWQARSRNRVLTADNDNCQFYELVTEDPQLLIELHERINVLESAEETIVFGELIGPGIQKGVACNQIDKKTFVIFDIHIRFEGKEEFSRFEPLDYFFYETDNFRVTGIHSYYDNENLRHVYHVNFGNAEMLNNFAAEIDQLTEEVGKCCPFIKAGWGIEGPGEGIVWKPTNFELKNNSDLIFKTKAAAHRVNKSGKAASVDTVKLGKVQDFVDYAVTENRLAQGIEYFNEMGLELTPENTSEYLKWVNKDVYKEESDVLDSSELTMKDVGKAISTTAREYYFKKVNEI